MQQRASVNHGQLLQAVATEDRRDDAGVDVLARHGMGEEFQPDRFCPV